MLRKTRVKNGLVSGIPAADPRITVYKGLPFAKPPIGNLRWQPPQPPDDWQGTLIADTFAPIPMQEKPGSGNPNDLYNKEWHVDPDIPMSEDCLYLNVWTPAKKADEKLPVMLWIFGGGMCCGYSSEMEFDGERIARRGVVLVSLNYRVNAFGFLAHKDLSQESNEGISGNYGLLDQLAGLKWIRDNISNFGGDPENVTLFGQSAGGRSVISHLVSPLSRGYFQKAIAQSGGGMILSWRNRYPNLSEAEKIGERFLETLGVRTINEARAIDAESLLLKSLEFIPMHRWGPIIDGRFMIEDPVDAVRNGRQSDIPVMAGSTTDEMVYRPAAENYTQLVRILQDQLGESAASYISACRVDQDQDIETAINKVSYNLSDLGNRVWAQIMAENYSNKLFLYRFGPDIPGDNAGVFHSSELWFVFETLAKCWRPFTGKHYDLARKMCNYWTNFAKYGNPNGKDCDGNDLPVWEPYDKGSYVNIFFGDGINIEAEASTDGLEILKKENMIVKKSIGIVPVTR